MVTKANFGWILAKICLFTEHFFPYQKSQNLPFDRKLLICIVRQKSLKMDWSHVWRSSLLLLKDIVSLFKYSIHSIIIHFEKSSLLSAETFQVESLLFLTLQALQCCLMRSLISNFSKFMERRFRFLHETPVIFAVVATVQLSLLIGTKSTS